LMKAPVHRYDFTLPNISRKASCMSFPRMACPPDPKILRFIMELLHPDEWGKHRKIDIAQEWRT